MAQEWKVFEAHVARELDLDQTITSGNKWFDQGDAVTRGLDDPWPIYADCKSTEKASMSIKAKDLRDYVMKAATNGRRFILPIRYWSKRLGVVPEDYVLLGFYDFKELLELARGALHAQRLLKAYRHAEPLLLPGVSSVVSDMEKLLGVEP